MKIFALIVPKMNAAYAQRAKEYVLCTIRWDRALYTCRAGILGLVGGVLCGILFSSAMCMAAGFLPACGVWAMYTIPDSVALSTVPHKKHRYITLVHLPNGTTYYAVHYESPSDPAEVCYATTYDPSLL